MSELVDLVDASGQVRVREIPIEETHHYCPDLHLPIAEPLSLTLWEKFLFNGGL